MIMKGELYTNNRFVAKVKVYPEESSSDLSIVPKNRNHFLYFYPDEHLTFHHIDDKGTFSMHTLVFREIHMIRTKVYYRFSIQETISYERMKNNLHQSPPYYGLVTNFTEHIPVWVQHVSDQHIEIAVDHQLEDTLHELFYYIGKKKMSYLLEHPVSTTNGTTQWSIQQKRIL